MLASLPCSEIDVGESGHPWLLLIDIDDESKEAIQNVGGEFGWEVLEAKRSASNRNHSTKSSVETIVFQVDRYGDDRIPASTTVAGLVFVGVTRPIFSELFDHLDEGNNVWMKKMIDGPLTESQILSLLR